MPAKSSHDKESAGCLFCCYGYAPKKSLSERVCRQKNARLLIVAAINAARFIVFSNVARGPADAVMRGRRIQIPVKPVKTWQRNF